MRDDDFFWEGVCEGKLLIQQCGKCGALRHPPLPMCPACQSLDWSPIQSSGQGQVLSWVMSKHPTQPEDTDIRVVVLVALKEGVRLISNLQGIAFDAIEVGLPVEVFYESFGDVVLPQFRPASAA
jgi:uncharacterized protein